MPLPLQGAPVPSLHAPSMLQTMFVPHGKPTWFLQVQLVAAVQALQVPVHAVAQQKPPTQASETQSLSAPHAAPFGFLGGGAHAPD